MLGGGLNGVLVLGYLVYGGCDFKGVIWEDGVRVRIGKLEGVLRIE